MYDDSTLGSSQQTLIVIGQLKMTQGSSKEFTYMGWDLGKR